MLNVKNIFNSKKTQSYPWFDKLRLSRRKDIKNVIWFILCTWIIANIILVLVTLFSDYSFLRVINNFLSPEWVIVYLLSWLYITWFAIFIAINLVYEREEFLLQIILFLILWKWDEYFSNEVTIFRNFYNNYIRKTYSSFVVSKSSVKNLKELRAKGVINRFETIIKNQWWNSYKYTSTVSAFHVITWMEKYPSYTNTSFIIKIKNIFFKEWIHKPVVVKRKSFNLREYIVYICLFLLFLTFIWTSLLWFFSSDEEVFVYIIMSLFWPYKYISIFILFILWLIFHRFMTNGRMKKIVTSNKILQKFRIESHDENFHWGLINDIHADKIQKFYRDCPLWNNITMYIFNNEVYINVNVKKYVGNFQRILRFLKGIIGNYSIEFDIEYIDKKIETMKLAEKIFDNNLR